MGSERVLYNQPKTLQERKTIARDFIRDFDFKLKLMVDTIDNNFNEAFAAWPERYWVIQRGVILFMAELGPYGFKLDLLEEFLAANFEPRQPSTNGGAQERL
jgi:hypothetical protein